MPGGKVNISRESSCSLTLAVSVQDGVSAKKTKKICLRPIICPLFLEANNTLNLLKSPKIHTNSVFPCFLFFFCYEESSGVSGKVEQ